MLDTPPRAYQVRAKTQQVIDYHHDESQPGKPLWLMVPGGVVALVCLLLEVLLVYRGFWDQTMDQSQASLWMALLAPIYIGGVFIFSYGYQMYDLKKALVLTAIIVFFTVAAVVIVAALAVLLGAGGKSSSSSSSSSKSSSASSGGTSSSGSSGGSHHNGLGGGVLVLGSPFGTRTVTKEVVHEVPVEPVAPQPFACLSCGSSYLPADQHFTCPSCGAPAPPGLIACAHCGKQYVPAEHHDLCPDCGTAAPARSA
jgi:hypothetical protein